MTSVDTTPDPTVRGRDPLVFSRCYEFAQNFRKCSQFYNIWHHPNDAYSSRESGWRPSSTHDDTEHVNPYPSFSTEAPKPDAQIESEKLSWWVHSILLPIALVLMALCFILGVVLIVKSYMMTKLRQNILTQMRRRRTTIHAPDNSYVQPGDMTASQVPPREDDGRAFPPPEVLLAARVRASQIRRTVRR